MKFIRVLLLSFSLVSFCNLFAQNNNPYQFINPKPASIMVSNETNIILRYPSLIDETTLSANLVKVEGTISGDHTGELILSDDDKTIVFNPNTVFASNEVVSVILTDGIKTVTGNYIPEFSFNFTTAPSGIAQKHSESFTESISNIDNRNTIAFNEDAINSLLPAPPITIDSINNPSPDYIFMATWDRNVPAKYGNFILILDSSGVIVDSVRVNGAPFDFQVQPNGLLSYALGDFHQTSPFPERICNT